MLRRTNTSWTPIDYAPCTFPAFNPPGWPMIGTTIPQHPDFLASSWSFEEAQSPTPTRGAYSPWLAQPVRDCRSVYGITLAQPIRSAPISVGWESHLANDPLQIRGSRPRSHREGSHGLASRRRYRGNTYSHGMADFDFSDGFRPPWLIELGQDSLWDRPYYNPRLQASPRASTSRQVTSNTTTYEQAITPYLQVEDQGYDKHNLTSRPSDWRQDYGPKRSLTTQILNFILNRRAKTSIEIEESSDQVKRALHPLLSPQPSHSPFSWDVTKGPYSTSSSVSTLACHPPAPRMRLYHPRLPWYIDITASNSTGVTVNDVFDQIHKQLYSRISTQHFWNEELGDEVREDIYKAFVRRCRSETKEMEKGVTKLDFMGRRVVFKGLVKDSKGFWVIKMGKQCLDAFRETS